MDGVTPPGPQEPGVSPGTPSTEAGRRLLDRLGGYMSPKAIGHALELIPEIEAEARQQGRHNLPDSVANNAYLASTNDANNRLLLTDAAHRGRPPDRLAGRRGMDGGVPMTPAEHVAVWQPRLRLSEWHVAISPVAPEEDDQRSSVDMDRNLHRAVIRFDPTLPEDQVERQTLHELLHVRLAEMEDVFRQVVEDDEVAKTWWARSCERTIEALVDALLPDSPRRDYRGGPAWVSAT